MSKYPKFFTHFLRKSAKLYTFFVVFLRCLETKAIELDVESFFNLFKKYKFIF